MHSKVYHYIYGTCKQSIQPAGNAPPHYNTAQPSPPARLATEPNGWVQVQNEWPQDEWLWISNSAWLSSNKFTAGFLKPPAPICTAVFKARRINAFLSDLPLHFELTHYHFTPSRSGWFEVVYSYTSQLTKLDQLRRHFPLRVSPQVGHNEVPLVQSLLSDD